MKDLFQIVFHKDPVWEMEQFHFHDGAEILFVTGGTATFLREAEMIRAVRGTVLLIPKGVLHLSVALPEREYARHAVHFDPAAVRPFCSGATDLLAAFDRTASGVLRLSEEKTRELEQLFAACQDRPERFGADLRRDLAFLELLIRLGELSREESRTAEDREAEQDRDFGRVSPVIRYIRENPAGNLSLEAVAEKFFYNKHYLCRIFKATAGISVGKYIAAVRIRHAAEFLRSGSSVQESGLRAGFKNNSNFISTFHKVMDVSPGQYRLQYRQNFASAAGRAVDTGAALPYDAER